MNEPKPYGGADRRRAPRFRLDDTLQVVDAHDGQEIGQVMDMHQQGFMLMCPQGAEQGREYQIKLLLPRHIDGCSELSMAAHCLWVAEPMTESLALNWAGFSIVPDSVRSLISLDDVLSEFGVEPTA